MEIWKRNLYVIWAAQFLAMAGMSMVVPFLPFYIRELGVTAQSEVEKWSGLVFAGPFMLSFLLTPYWGSLGDRYGKKVMVIRAIFGLSLSQFLIGISSNVYELFIFRLFQGAASGFIAAALALVSSSTPQEKSGYSIGLLQTSISAGTIIGPLIGGLTADITSHRAVFFITAVLCFISGLAIIFYVKEPEKIKQEKRINVFDNMRFVFSDQILPIALISIILIQISISITQPAFALFVESITEEKTYLSTIAGAVYGVTGIATAISSPYWGKRNDRKGYSKNLYIALAGASVSLILHSFINSNYELLPLRVILGLCIGGMVPTFYTMINKNIPEERKSGIMGIASSSTLFGNLTGPLIYSSIVFFTGVKYVFLFSGIIIIVNILFLKFNKV